VYAAALMCISALSGCALPESRPIPAVILTPPPGDLQLIETSADPQKHAGATVRWGGNVIHFERDGAGNALIQVVERRLDADGRPIEGSASDGRFMIKATADVDPEFYARDRIITVSGTIDGGVTARIGEQTLSMPVVHVSEFMLWLPRYRYDPYWRHYDDHWYGPRVRFGVRMSNYQNSHRRH